MLLTAAPTLYQKKSTPGLVNCTFPLLFSPQNQCCSCHHFQSIRNIDTVNSESLKRRFDAEVYHKLVLLMLMLLYTTS